MKDTHPVQRTLRKDEAQARALAMLAEGVPIVKILPTIGRTQRAWENWREREPGFARKVDLIKTRVKLDKGDTSRADSSVRGLGFVERRQIYFDHDTPDHHLEMVRATVDQPADTISLVLAPPESAKALALDTPVPTPDGWSTIAQLEIGDRVFDHQGTPVPVVGKSEVFTGRPCFAVELSDGERIVADAAHLWLTRTRKTEHAQSVKTTAVLAETVEAHGRPNHGIPVMAGCDLPEPDLPIDPYVLGYWLGDGTTSNGTITCGAQDLNELVANLTDCGEYPNVKQFPSSTSYTVRCGLPPGVCGRGHPTPRGYTSCAGCSHDHYLWRKYGIPMPTGRFAPLQVRLRDLGVIDNKHVPANYMRAGYKQRLALVQGLMDSDGTVAKERGTVTFCTTLPALRDAMTELLWSLGIKNRTTESRAKVNGKDCGPVWKVAGTPRSDTPVFRLRRKLERQLPADTPNDRDRWRIIKSVTPVESVPTQCIQVPGGLYAVGRTFAITHNTTLLVDLVNDVLAAVDPNYRFCLISESRDLSRKILGQIQDRMVDTHLFSSFIETYGPFKAPTRDERKGWNSDYMTVLQASHDEKEPSVEARGAGSRIYGGRYDKIHLDDLQSLETLNKTKPLVDYIRQTLVSRLHKGVGSISMWGSRVGPGDVYVALLEAGIVDFFVKIPALKTSLKRDDHFYEDKHGKVQLNPNCPEVSYWPEYWSMLDLAKKRQKVGERVWAQTYMQQPVSDEGAAFPLTIVQGCLDRQRILGKNDHPATFMSVDPALGGNAAFGVFGFTADRLFLQDLEAQANMGNNENIIRKIADLAARYRPSALVLEVDGQGNKGLFADERLRELADAFRFDLVEHRTTGSKTSHAFGVAAMASSLVRNEIVLPYGDEDSRRKVDPLVKELTDWRSDVPARLLVQDRAMVLWFAWRYWVRQRESLTTESASIWAPTWLAHTPTRV